MAEFYEAAALGVVWDVATGQADLDDPCAEEDGGDAPAREEGSDDPCVGKTWIVDRWVSAEWIAGLALGHRVPVHHTGVRLKGAYITGKLDLSFAAAVCPIVMVDCSLAEAPDLSFSSLPYLSLKGSCVPGLEATGVKIAGDLVFEGSCLHGATLKNAEIGGDLLAEQARLFPDAEGAAMTADGLSVRGDVFLKGATCEGETRLIGARIDGDLDCDGGTFTNPEPPGDTLRLEDAVIGGNLYLGMPEDQVDQSHDPATKSFYSEGAIRMSGATIGRGISCAGGSFVNRGKGQAIHADGLKVEDDAWFGNRGEIHPGEPILHGCSITGEFRMIGARVGGLLDFTGTEFRKGQGDPPEINLSSIEVGRDLIWNPAHIDADFHIYLDHASVGVFKDSGLDAWPTRPNGSVSIEGFTYRLPGFRRDSRKPVEDRLGFLGLSPDFRPGPYSQLMKVYLEAGDVKNALAVGLALEHARRPTLPPARRLMHRVWGWTTGFGYLPHRGLAWLAGVVAIGLLIVMLALDQGLVIPVERGVPAQATSCNPEYPCFSPLPFVVETLVPLVDLDQRAYWRLDSSGASWAAGRYVVGWLFPILIGAGWLFTSVLVAGIATFAYREARSL